jgi:hypothetical protein
MFIVVGALGIIVMLIWLRIYRDPTLREEHILKGDDSADASADEIAEQLDEATTAEADTVVEGAEKVGWGTLFTKPNTYFMIIGAFGIFYTVWVYLTWLPSYIETDLGFSLQETGWLAALPFLMGVLGVLTGGWFSGVLIRRGSPAIVARKVPIVGGAVLAAASVFPTAYLDNVPLIIALLSLGYFFSRCPSAACGRWLRMWRRANRLPPSVRSRISAASSARPSPRSSPVGSSTRRELQLGLPRRRDSAHRRCDLLWLLRQGPQPGGALSQSQRPQIFIVIGPCRQWEVERE